MILYLTLKGTIVLQVQLLSTSAPQNKQYINGHTAGETSKEIVSSHAQPEVVSYQR